MLVCFYFVRPVKTHKTWHDLIQREAPLRSSNSSLSSATIRKGGKKFVKLMGYSCKMLRFHNAFQIAENVFKNEYKIFAFRIVHLPQTCTDHQGLIQHDFFLFLIELSKNFVSTQITVASCSLCLFTDQNRPEFVLITWPQITKQISRNLFIAIFPWKLRERKYYFPTLSAIFP